MKMTVRFFSICRTNYENYEALGVFWGYTNRISFSSFPKILILDPNWRVLLLLNVWLTSAINQQHINYSLIHKQILPECNCSVAIIKFVHTINKEWAHSYWKILPVLVTITGRLLLFFPSHSHSDCILASNTHSNLHTKWAQPNYTLCIWIWSDDKIEPHFVAATFYFHNEPMHNVHVSSTLITESDK